MLQLHVAMNPGTDTGKMIILQPPKVKKGLFWPKIGTFNDTELGFPLVDEQYAIVTHQKVW